MFNNEDWVAVRIQVKIVDAGHCSGACPFLREKVKLCKLFSKDLEYNDPTGFFVRCDECWRNEIDPYDGID